MKLSEAELKELAAQLRCPEGEPGLRVGEMMQFTNGNLIQKVIDALGVKNGNDILEIGPGNGTHVQYLLDKAADLKYTGIDISETMIAAAARINEGAPNVSFILSDGRRLPFEDASFDNVFTANTIYFWEHPQAYANEIARVLRSSGIATIGFIPRSTMQHIPFAKYGFTMHDTESVSALLQNAGMAIISTKTDKEFVTSNNGEQIEREILIIAAVKI